MCLRMSWAQVGVCLACIISAGIDVALIVKNVQYYEEIKPYVYASALDECYKPQIVFRALYSLYGLNLSLVLLSVTLLTIFFEEGHPSFNKGLLIILGYSYFAFGPTMLTFCGLALTDRLRDRLICVCDPIAGSRGPETQINYQTLFQIAISTAVSVTVTATLTFFYVVWSTQLHLRDETSLVSRIYFKALSWAQRREAR